MTAVINSNTSVTLRWLPADPSLWNGIIASYIVEYQRQEQVEFDDNSEQLEYVMSSASIPSLPEHPLVNSPDPRLVSLPLREESLQLGGLEENFVYQFVVYYDNSVGRSEMNSPLRINIPPSGRLSVKHQSIEIMESIFLCPVPSGSPINITLEAESSSELFISWQPPEQLKQNGIITGYRILISSSDTSSQARAYTVPADINSLRVTGTMISYS